METATKVPEMIRKTDIDAKAKELKERKALPIAPGENVSFKELQAWIELLTPEMLGDGNRILIYLYRQYPFIIRQKTDMTADNNIDVFSGDKESLLSVLNEDHIIRVHGGGKYKFLVKDLDKPKETKGGYFEARLIIPENIHPPKLDLREVDWDHKVNKGFKVWAKTNKLIDENNMPVITEKKLDTPAPQNESTVQVVKLFMDFVSKMGEKDQQNLRKQLGAEDSLGKSIGEILLEKMKQDDPNKQLQTVTTLMAAMKGMQPEKQSSDIAVMMPLIMQMMKDQAEASNRQFQMMLTLMQGQKEEKGETKDSISQLKDLLEVARELKGGNGGGGHKSQIAEIISEAAPIAAPLFGMFQNMFALKAQQGVAQPNPNVPQPSVSTSPTVQAGMSNMERINQENKQNMPNNPNPPQIEQPNNQAAAIIQQYGQLIISKLSSDGWEFAASIADMFGDPMAASIAKHGPEALLSAAKSVPEFWNQIEATYGEAHLRKWLGSFCNYKEEMQKAEMEEDDES